MTDWKQLGERYEYRAVNCKVCGTPYAECLSKEPPCCKICEQNDTHAEIRERP